MATVTMTRFDVAAMTVEAAISRGVAAGVAAGSIVTDGRHSIAYGDLAARIDAARDILADSGVHPQDCVAVESGNSVASIVLLLALMRQGTSFILAPPTAAADIKPVPRFCRWRISVGNGELPPARPFAAITRNPDWSGAVMAPSKLMLRTSGSMGVSKIVVHSHAGLLGNAWNCVSRYTFRAESRCCIPVPIAHMYGGGAALLPSILAGASVDVIDRPNVLSLLDHEKRFRPTMAFVTPTICDMLLKAYKTPRDIYDVVVTSGQRISDETFVAFDRAIGGRLVNQYGSSEMGATAACRPDDGFDLRHRSIGAPMDGVRLEIAGGVRGELLVHHPFGYEGYLDDVGHWLHKAAPGAAFVTGDLAEEDGSGAIRIVGRSGSSVNRDGYLVVLEEIERLMETLTDVARVVVIATGAGTARGERLAAFCVPHVGRTPDGASIRAQCFDIMPRYALPDEVYVLESLPLLPSGKVDRRSLAAGLAQPDA